MRRASLSACALLERMMPTDAAPLFSPFSSLLSLLPVLHPHSMPVPQKLLVRLAAASVPDPAQRARLPFAARPRHPRLCRPRGPAPSGGRPLARRLPPSAVAPAVLALRARPGAVRRVGLCPRQLPCRRPRARVRLPERRLHGRRAADPAPDRRGRRAGRAAERALDERPRAQDHVPRRVTCECVVSSPALSVFSSAKLTLPMPLIGLARSQPRQGLHQDLQSPGRASAPCPARGNHAWTMLTLPILPRRSDIQHEKFTFDKHSPNEAVLDNLTVATNVSPFFRVRVRRPPIVRGTSLSAR